MNARDPGTDASFEWLRRAHRSERAPDALRRRALERARDERSRGERRGPRARRWLARGSWLALAAAVTAGVWFGVSRTGLDGSGPAPTAAGDVVMPTAEPAPSPSSPACSMPLPRSPFDPAQVDFTAKTTGLQAGVFETETARCGPLTRRYLVRPSSEQAPSSPSSPVLIVLHDAGQSPEQAQIATRWWFDDVSQRKFAVLVYANGAPILTQTGGPSLHVGIWQTDAAAHPAVDDFAYLQGIVRDLRAKRGLAQGEVFLAGYGSGAVMALAAALQHPDRYAGVAAFLPTRLPRKEELGAALSAPGQLLPPALGRHGLGSIFVAQPRAAGENPSAVAFEWAALFGSEAGPVRVTRQKPGIRRIDSTLVGGVQLRILSLPKQVNPFPDPGGTDPLARAASEKRPDFFDGPGAAWEFFEQWRPPAEPSREKP
jgi:poly(3-hydroxybutyrate) depolymerase